MYIIYTIYIIYIIGKYSYFISKIALQLVHLGQTFPRSDEIKLLKFIFNIYHNFRKYFLKL